MSEEKSSPLPLILLIGLLLVAAACIAWWLKNRETDANGDDAIARDDALELVRQRNEGIAKVENAEYSAAAEIFQRIHEKLPDDPMPVRNRAIALILQYNSTLEDGKATPSIRREARDAAGKAIDDAILAEPDSAVVRYLAARHYARVASREITNDAWRKKERAALAKATQLDDQAIYVWYRRFDSLKFDLNNDDANRKRAEFNRQAYRLRPRNLLLMAELLKVLVEIEADDLPQKLQEMEKILRPVMKRTRDPQKRADNTKLLDRTLALWKAKPKTKEDRDEAYQSVSFLANVMKGTHAFRLDKRELTPHELEFLLTDFTADFYKRADLPEPELPEGIAVKFQAASGDWKFPEIADARAVRIADFDLDTRNDVIVAHGKRVTVFSRPKDAKTWQKVAEVELPFAPHGLAVNDLDYDVPKPPNDDGTKPKKKQPPKTTQSDSCVTADVDVVAYGPDAIALLRNTLDNKTGQRSLQPVKQAEELANVNQVVTVAIADFDHDSDLDLVLSTKAGIKLWTNRGDMTFEDATPYSELPPAGTQATAVVPIDFNRDVLLDIVVSGPDFKAAGYLENIRHGRFRYRKFEQPFGLMAKSSALAAVDADANVSWDWISAGTGGVALTRTRTIGTGRFQFLESKSIHKKPVVGVRTLDYDNDGYQDLLAWAKNDFFVYRGGPDGVFQKVDGLFEKPIAGISDVALEDIDGDGDLDLAIVANGKIELHINAGGNANNWVRIALHGQQTVKDKVQRCNIHGVGSLMELKAGPMYQARVVKGPVTHFGLGKRKSADTVRVLWTNGIPQNEIAPAGRKSICSRQDLAKGSCPYLYVWNGKKFEFVTDLLWAAPIGLQSADGVIAPSRPWEYLKIPGHMVKAVDGEYRLLFTEELWEAAYFDHVRLFAVDHPADTQIFTNEKVGPASLAQERIHTVRHPRVPVAARDQTGRDVLPLVAKRDGRFVKSYPYRITQGLTPEHYLEIDFGKLKNPQRIMLYLTGWMFPSDTSINVWLSHHPNRPRPQPPSLWVPDAKGEWKNVVPFTGFPGGKTKTIALDLSKVFLTDDYRVRIKTTMEFRWDAAFFTVDDPPVKFTRRPLQLKQAELFYRGFSKRTAGKYNGPESYDATRVDKSPHWPPMEGRFTRYGNVTELLTAQDDRLVVMGAGDAMTLRFAVPKDAPPPGWTRDYILYNVGWDKDADLNTVLGQTAEPLPRVGMQRYPFVPNDPPPNTPAYRQYLRKYQTRRQPAARFWRLPARGTNERN